MVRADGLYGFESSKLVDDVLLNSLMRKNPTSSVLTRADMMDFQSDCIMESRIINPETVFRPFDLDNMGVQGVFFFLLSTDPTLETVEKTRLYFSCYWKSFPTTLFLRPCERHRSAFWIVMTSFTQSGFEESINNVESTIRFPVSGNRVPISSSTKPSHYDDILNDATFFVLVESSTQYGSA